MREIIRHHVEYGCKRMDKIEFTAPKEVLIRCESGCEPTYKYTRPSKVGFKAFQKSHSILAICKLRVKLKVDEYLSGLARLIRSSLNVKKGTIET